MYFRNGKFDGSKDLKKKNIFTIRTAIKIGVVMFLILYLNGVLSNLRTGYGWNDNHVIFFAGAINSSWPKFLPMQLAWAYSYITSPLANLNLTSSVYNGSIDFIRLIVTTVPIFIAKRLFPQYMIDGINEVVLHSNILNASTLLIVISRYKDTDFLLKNNAFRG